MSNVSQPKFTKSTRSDLERRLVGMWLIVCALCVVGVVLWAVV